MGLTVDFFIFFICSDMVPLPSIEGCEDKFVFYRLVDCDPDKVSLIRFQSTFKPCKNHILLFQQFHFNDVIRTFFIIADSRLVQPDVPMNNGGDIPIFDMTGFTLRHLTKVILSTLRVYMKYTQVIILFRRIKT